jgi:hypothetical protein
MANALQLRRGTTTQHNSFTGLAGEVTVDTDKETVVVHDGSTAGGFPLARASDLTNFDADTLDGKQLATIESEYQAFANTAAANVVDSAPGTLDTLNELAAALGDDANFATTVTNSIATKLNSSAYTAADVLTKIKTVDGSGSGLDADTLDGVHLSNIARTDTHEDFQSSVTFANINIDPDGYSSGKSGGFGTVYDGSGWQAPGLFISGGTGKAAAFAAAGGNIYFGTQDGTNTNSMSSWLTVTQSSKTASFDGKIIANSNIIANSTLEIEEVVEKVQTSTSTSGTITWYSNSQAIVYYTANQTANRTINFVGDGSTTMNSFLDVGKSYTASVVMTQGSTAYYLNAYQVDGSTVTPKWSGGSAPTEGNADSLDVYTFTIIKTADATYTVLASQTQFA